MKRVAAWRRYLRFWGPDPDSDIEDELRFHFEEKVDELTEAGMAPEEARREAARQFGPVGAVRRECSAISKGKLGRASRAEYLAGWWRDVRYGARMLGKNRGTTAAAVLILAVGIGANTAVFTFFDRLLFRELPLPNVSELVTLASSSVDEKGERKEASSFSYEAYVHLRDNSDLFANLAGGSVRIANEGRGRERIEHPAWAAPVSGNYFATLGGSAILGRVLTPEDDLRSSPEHVAVASHWFWTQRYGQSPDVLGKIVYLENVPFTIVGVMPRGFAGLSRYSGPDLYIPLESIRSIAGDDVFAFGKWITVVGRLKPGVTAEAARTNVQARLEQALPIPGRYKEAAGTRIEWKEVSGAGVAGEKKRSLVLLAALVGVLLLMGCVNVSCLQMARGAARQQEIAIRLSLGAGKARVLRQALIESGLLALSGGVAGLLVAYGACRLLLGAFGWQDDPIDLTPDWRVLGFGLIVSLVTGVLSGIAPAVQFLRGKPVALTQERTVAPFTSGRALVVVEVALSLVLVAGATVFVRSFQNLRSAPKGFDASRVSVVQVIAPSDYAAPLGMSQALADSVRTAPGVEAVTASDTLLFNDGTIGYTVSRPNSSAPGRKIVLMQVGEGYFETLRIGKIAGREFTVRDDASAPPAVILSESLAGKLFPGENPVGLPVRIGDGYATEVVGVVRDIKVGNVRKAAPEVVYMPLAQKVGGAFMHAAKLYVRSRLGPQDVAALVRERIKSGRWDVEVDRASSLETEIGASFANDRIRMEASSLFGALALFLIIAGIYGLMAYSVMRRTREIGLRVAVGSSSGGIVWLVLRDSLKLVVVGVMLGVPGAVMAMRAVSGMVFGLAPVDPVTLGIAAAVLMATGIGASLAPAWRAARLNPVEALRVQ